MRTAVQLGLSLGLALSALGIAGGAEISVTVNERVLAFSDVGPRMVRGRVMVPLRGIFQALGASVVWDGPTQTISASRGSTDVELRIGDRTGLVDGLPVALDVPAMLLGGTTMVPLRFIGESLGADVGWSEFTQTVAITTQGNTDPGLPPASARPEISSFGHNATGWLNGGSTLEVSLTGTSGGAASFTVPGIARDLPMREVATGRYEGSWGAASGQDGLTVTGAAMVGALRVGAQTSLIQAGTTLSVDTQAPRISAMTPLPDSRLVPQPSISAVFDDLVGSGIDPATVRLSLDGHDITDQAVVTSSFVSFRPAQPLASGEHRVVVSAADRAGNRVDRSWRFSTASVAEEVRSFRWTAAAGAGPGDGATITLEASPGGRARFAVGTAVRDQPMPETQPGRYVGEYILRRGDRLAELRVSGVFTTREGHVYAYEAENNSAVVAPPPGTAPPALPGPLTAPRITAPRADERVGNTVVVVGTGTRGRRVGLKVEYQTTLLGVLSVQGALAELAVDVDANGRWQTNPIDLGTLLSGRNTRYLVTAWTIGTGDQRSDTVTLALRHR